MGSYGAWDSSTARSSWNNRFSALRDESDNMLGASGLADIASQLNAESAECFLNDLPVKLRNLNPKNLTDDNVTIVVARANTEGVSLKDNLMAPLRLLRGLFR